MMDTKDTMTKKRGRKSNAEKFGITTEDVRVKIPKELDNPLRKVLEDVKRELSINYTPNPSDADAVRAILLRYWSIKDGEVV